MKRRRMAREVERKELPRWFRVLGALLLLVGVACGIAVVLGFVQAGNPTVRASGVAVGGAIAVGNLAVFCALCVRGGKVRGGSGIDR